MAPYIAFLRAINVSGQKRIKMHALRNIFEQNPCTNVATYIQSGNVVFEHPESNAQKLRSIVEAFLAPALGYAVPTLIRTASEMTKIIAANPFADRTEMDVKQVYVAYLERIPNAAEVQALMTATNENEEAIVIGQEAWLFYRLGAGKAKLSNAVLERKMKTVATMRNWNSTCKLQEMVTEGE